MPEARERKKADKIKEKSDRRVSPVKKTMRRRMTAKLQKELMEQKQGRESDSGLDMTPETQAAEQAERKIYTAADSLREHTSDAVSKSISRHQRKQQKKRRRTAQAPASPEDREAALPNVQEQIRERPADGRKTRPPESSRSTITSSDKAAASERPPAGPAPEERMRQKARADAQARHKAAGTALTHPERKPAPAHTSAVFDDPPINPNRERPRRPFAPKEKPTGSSFVPKTRQNAAAVKSTMKSASMVARGQAAARPLEQARRRVRHNAQRRLLQQSANTTKTALGFTRRAAVTVRAASSLMNAVAGLLGGTLLIPIFCLIILAAAVMASPFGILFSNEPSPGAVPLNAAVSQINMELTDKLAGLQTEDYDAIDIQGQPPDWREGAAVFASKTAGAGDGVDVAALIPDRVDRLKTVFWDMCAITAGTETVDHPASGDSEGWTEKILHITIAPKAADGMRTQYAFSKLQNDALTELLAEADGLGALLGDLSVSQEQARSILQNLPPDLGSERRTVVESACKLVGKVTYYWGGKSLVLGWDSRWGTLRKVTAAGSTTTGSYLPYGLDCSGMVDWAFYNATGGEYVIGHGGGAHAQHTYCTDISWDEAQPGDLVFYPEDEHVGIVGDWDDNGDLLIIHCASSANNVVITGASGFTSVAKPIFYSE